MKNILLNYKNRSLLVIVLALLLLCELNAQQSYPLGNGNSTSDVRGWRKLGTLTLDQHGRDVYMHIIGGNGFNGSVLQNSECHIRFRTSNGNHPAGVFMASGSFYNTGRGRMIELLRVIQVNASTWEFYAFINPWSGLGATIFIETVSGGWTTDINFTDYGTTAPVGSGIFNDLTEELFMNSDFVSVGKFTIKNINNPNPIVGYRNPLYLDATNYGSNSSVISFVKNGSGIGMLGTDLNANGSNDLFFIAGNNSGSILLNPNGGNVGIGTGIVNNTYRLAVEGTIGARKIKVTQGSWADYVFKPSYKLRPLSELEAYIKKYKHLPDVPSEQEVLGKDIDISETQVLLLKKIEELTLYVIALEKKNNLLANRILKIEKNKK